MDDLEYDVEADLEACIPWWDVLDVTLDWGYRRLRVCKRSAHASRSRR